jgi:hypothetical protein
VACPPGAGGDPQAVASAATAKAATAAATHRVGAAGPPLNMAALTSASSFPVPLAVPLMLSTSSPTQTDALEDGNLY